jgi:hypothetical protein
MPPLETKSQRSRKPRHAFWKVGAWRGVAATYSHGQKWDVQEVVISKSWRGPRRHCTQTAQIDASA